MTSRLLQRFDLGALLGLGSAGRRHSAPGALIEALRQPPLPAETLRIRPREQEIRFRLAPLPGATHRTEVTVWLNVERCQAFVIRFERPVDDPHAPPSQQVMAPERSLALLERHIRTQCRHYGWQQVKGG
ncbi:hypothetical protein C7446_0150 [Kushneria sinocarnis]|uniref:Uncharacterized protein n=1 Tax=Kushneria sinocarnis TaxID=595502 RepID=A0A420X0W8_9GAMM|nr:hypothetical protein [Kushneria sinocarnis]RKR07339.1 hypothetical protein C7446_0150 [Kushneria sinocarnis]